MMTPQVEMRLGELDKSIVELSKRKLKLLKEVNDIKETIFSSSTTGATD